MRTLLWGLCALVASLGPAAASDGDRPHGLMWNKTGLPLVFPLIVKSAAGQDFYIVLSTAEDQAPALAAYVRGGVFFRVLVPPGLYHVEFAAGSKWQSEKDLFGEGETDFFALPDPLEFAILDASTKSGHSIDLTDWRTGVTVSATFVCQGTLPRDTARIALPPSRVVETDPVGQEILKRRFERGETVFGAYDRQRQQDDFDPPVLGLPQVPLARPEPRSGTRSSVHSGDRLYERPC